MLQSKLAQYLLQVEVGERLLPVRSLATRYDTSIGAVSETLAELENSGAFSRERRGHLGSFVLGRSLSRLWLSAETAPMVIAFPLPSVPRLEGLATALKTILTDAGIDIYFIFIRGSHTRLRALAEHRCHAVVMSAFAADELCDCEERIALRLPPESYISEHCVFYRHVDAPSGRKQVIGIDRDSHDIERLSELEFAEQDVQFIPITYVQIPRYLREGQIDAAVWNIDDMKIHLDDEIAYRRLSEKVHTTIGKRTTAAAIVTPSDSDTTQIVLRGILNAQRINEIQGKVISGEIVPQY